MAGTQYASVISSQSQLLGAISNFQALSNNSSIEAARVLAEQAQEFNRITNKDELIDNENEENDGDEE